MDILLTIVYIILFVIMMLFVFSIGMLRKLMPRREILLVLIVAFLIGAIGGAFFLEPIYQELPSVMGNVEKAFPDNEETLYLELPSSVDVNELRENLSSMEGFKSFNETGFTFTLWHFNDREYAYFQEVIGNIDSHYKNYTVNQSGKIDITIDDNYTATQGLKSFSDWYKLVYGEILSYAQIHAILVVSSSNLDDFEDALLERGIVANDIEGPIQSSIAEANDTMLSVGEFACVTGAVGVVVAIMGIYFDNMVVAYRKFRRFLNKKAKR